MTKKMLIDAAHPEEVRVAVIDQGKVEDFDFESASRKPLRGNIYLARVTRVEPSLQAAFVEYGGNRHGFLAFNEIHPDYYQIPVSDRQILQKAEAEEAALAAELELMQRGDEIEDDEDEIQMGAPASDDEDDDEAGDDEISARAENDEDNGAEDAAAEDTNDDDESDEEDEQEEDREEEDREEEEDANDADIAQAEDDDPEQRADDHADNEDHDPSSVADGEQPIVQLADDDHDNAGDDAAKGASKRASAADDYPDRLEDREETDRGDGEPADDDVVDDKKVAARNAAKSRAALFERYKDAKRKRARLVRNYKIQEVIKRRQILLIQVVKEERGNKGAALTTYLSLAGRYCVLMPNTARGGGISRKIPSAADRRRLRRVVDSLDVPQGMGLIIRTAGAKRTKTEIKRDYDYLIRLWESIRTLTLKSIAPCLVYEEASLIKRAIRDLYDKDISKVYVEGEAGYREAKDFMKMLMPSHAKNVQPYKDKAPIFLKSGVETQLDNMYQPSVRLQSGGYIVIHQTEALIAIDVNSGRSTRERNIEQTALKTNIEAAREAARQFRLRDLAGLVVIDFIDMEEPRNNRMVEKKFKDAIKADRARIQVGRISNFGLLELSRQRRRSGIVDGTTHSCPTCAGAGFVRSHEMASLRILRAIEGEAISGKVGRIEALTSLEVSLYILNHNRDWLRRIEDVNGVTIEITADTSKAGDTYELEKSGVPKARKERAAYISADQSEVVDLDADDEPGDDITSDGDQDNADGEREGGRKKRRRRRKRKDAASRADEGETIEAADEDADGAEPADASEAANAGDNDDDDKPKRRRRRGRRGGKRNRRNADENAETQSGQSADIVDSDSHEKEAADHQPAVDNQGDTQSDTRADSASHAVPDEEPAQEDTPGDEPVAEPARPANGEVHVAATPQPVNDLERAGAPPEKKKSNKKGWWQRAVGG